MVLQNFQACNKAHSKDFQYCCIKGQKVFCSSCWFKSEHYRMCNSSRCGNYQKISHLVINRVLEIKNSFYIEKLSSSYEKYESFRVKFLQLNYQMTEMLKEWVDQKVPLFTWAMMNDMLHSKYSEHASLNCNKYDSLCTQMLKTIKSNDQSQKASFLEAAVSNFNDINHELEGKTHSMHTLKNKAESFKTAKVNKDGNIDQIIEHCRKNLGHMLTNVKVSFKSELEKQISKLLQNYDPNIIFKGVSFLKAEGPNFKRKQCFKGSCSKLIDLIPSDIKEPGQLYNDLNLSKSESNPEQLLQISKIFIKEKLFQVHSQIESFKSSFPYKYAYVISTCIEADENYEKQVLNLERTYLKTLMSGAAVVGKQSLSTIFYNSLNIVIMGPQVIMVRFYNMPEWSFSMKIFNYKKQRTEYYQAVRQCLGLTKDKRIKEKKANQTDWQIEYEDEQGGNSSTNLSLASRAYCHFQVVHDELFNLETENRVFEGQRVASARGMQLFENVVQDWRKTAKINIDFNCPKDQVIPLIV